MKIPEKNPVVNLEAYIQKVDSGNKKSDQGENSLNDVSMGEEKVELSSRAKDIQRIKNAVANVPEVRAEKVSRLKRSIEEGTYNVKGEEVARKIVKESLLDEIL